MTYSNRPGIITGPLLFPLDQDEPAQVGKDQEVTILKEINAFEDDHEKFMDSLKGVE